MLTPAQGVGTSAPAGGQAHNSHASAGNAVRRLSMGALGTSVPTFRGCGPGVRQPLSTQPLPGGYRKAAAAAPARERDEHVYSIAMMNLAANRSTASGHRR